MSRLNITPTLHLSGQIDTSKHSYFNLTLSHNMLLSVVTVITKNMCHYHAPSPRWGDVYRVVDVGTWNRASEKLLLNSAAVRWDNATSASLVPESVCSHACQPGEFRVQLDPKCCWECRPCRSNEIVADNGTSCAECDVLYWPEPEHASACLPIIPTSYTWRHTVSLLGITPSVIGMVQCIVVFVFYVRNCRETLIKATTLELSVVGLIGAIIAYIAAVLMLSQPTDASCYVSHVATHLGFCVTYASLLTVSRWGGHDI